MITRPLLRAAGILFGLACAIASLGCTHRGGGGGAALAAPATAPASGTAMNALDLELRFPKAAYRSSETTDAELVFRNRGAAPVRIALPHDGFAGHFVEFALVGEYGSQFLTGYHVAWMDPVVHRVKAFEVAAGAQLIVPARRALAFPDTGAGQFRGERFVAVAIYRDYSRRHQVKDVVRGILISSPSAPFEVVLDGQGILGP